MQFLSTKIGDLSVDEFKELIQLTVKAALDDLVEDLVALSSEKFILSIKDAREDQHKGNVKSFEEAFDV
ncbi:MAG: hypothetical protein HeimC3_23130 [Candidatus Heimdallarchaeota archaeon LC_3]|nr:MAG: hypothetical protein HeimC3_23130 [Candidatus Heimdallarchaeota archaeon LC_3]